MSNLVRFHYGENNINTGPLKEIPEICVDHFFGDDLNSSIFFLSHAHTVTMATVPMASADRVDSSPLIGTSSLKKFLENRLLHVPFLPLLDHLVGLETDEFVRRLRQPGIKLYCHPLTPILLGSFQRYLGGPEGIEKLIAEKKIVPLDAKMPTSLRVNRASGSLNVTVTLLPAGHCPGSVMFLFETSNYRILHTGDFRLDVEDLRRMPYLHDDNDRKVPKTIDHLYVDTTFCSTSANLFPNRKNVLKESMQHIRDWVGKSKKHVIDLRFSAKFAHEYVLLELNKLFGQKIHVTPERHDIYKYIPELYEIVTLDNSSQFHLCGNRNCVEDCQVITIKFSSMWYTRGNREDKEHIAWHGKNMTLCYSMHSSLNEIAWTIDYLKPRIVTPLVLPKNSKLAEVEKALKSATSTPYEFRDYHSSRNIFRDATTLTETLCAEERDETYLAEGDVDELGKHDIAGEYQFESSMELELPDDSPSKRPRLGEELRNVWQYKFSPSPKSKSSQGSSDEASSSQSTNDGSQEQDDLATCKEGLENGPDNLNTNDLGKNPFLLPQPPRPLKANVRRNLSETDFLSNSSKNAECSQQCDMTVNYDSDDMNDSQRF